MKISVMARHSAKWLVIKLISYQVDDVEDNKKNTEGVSATA